MYLYFVTWKLHLKFVWVIIHPDHSAIITTIAVSCDLKLKGEGFETRNNTYVLQHGSDF
jgi:hypothetical protein